MIDSSARKHIYIIYTGGTIGMTRTPHGYAPQAGYLAQRMEQMPALADPAMPTYILREYTPLLDSSNLTPAHWQGIAQDIAEHYQDFDGFVVLHGTDTMSYSASALSFILESLGKPVILTGSQIPLAEVRSDARENLITSMMLAAHYPIPEVCLYFHGKLLRGNRSTKVSASGLEAFESPNLAPLAEVGVHITLYSERLRPMPKKPLTLHLLGQCRIGALRLFPGITASILNNVLQEPLQGLVLETYGAGNAPTNPEFLAVLHEASARGVVIVNCSQCLRGMVVMGAYETGDALSKAGVISGGDMTAEAALSKLFFLFGKGLTHDDVRSLMLQNIAGEVSAVPV